MENDKKPVKINLTEKDILFTRTGTGKPLDELIKDLSDSEKENLIKSVRKEIVIYLKKR